METLNLIALYVGYFTITIIILSILLVFIAFGYDSRRAILAMFNLFIHTEKSQKDLEYHGFITRKVVGRIWFARRSN